MDVDKLRDEFERLLIEATPTTEELQTRFADELSKYSSQDASELGGITVGIIINLTTDVLRDALIAAVPEILVLAFEQYSEQ